MRHSVKDHTISLTEYFLFSLATNSIMLEHSIIVYKVLRKLSFILFLSTFTVKLLNINSFLCTIDEINYNISKQCYTNGIECFDSYETII